METRWPGQKIKDPGEKNPKAPCCLPKYLPGKEGAVNPLPQGREKYFNAN